MAKKPSSRTHRMHPLEGLNITPLIDMVTCLMFFLLMFAGIIPVVIIDAPLPKIASTAEEVRQATEDKNKLEVVVDIGESGLVVKVDGMGSRNFPKAADGKIPFTEFHKHLVDVHIRNPKSTEITLVPDDSVPYALMIEVMDASRELVQGDPGFQAMPPEAVGKPESQQFNRLFPDVSLGGV